MGKLLSLGPATKIKYPITINKLLKKPGDEIKKREALIQFTFKWKRLVGDDYGEEWEEEQTTIGDWDSPVEGHVKLWKIKEGMIIDGDMEFIDIEEACPHSIQYAGLCGMCGKDMTETSWASASNDTERAKINMIHDQNFLTVSEGEASRAEQELQRRLLKHKKLSLVVDLDQTIIHACIEPTVGEWQRDPKSPNYEAVKDVKSFQLNDDGPRGLASGCWYYIKMRPGLSEFLSKISEMYELHVYTMGTRAYALNIAKIVDPDRKLFGDRIISRDENGNMTAKSLARLFPVDTKMVVIIDDRADVWPKNRPNLIKVHPYDFFLGIGDINSSFLPKREELPKVSPGNKKRITDKPEEKSSEATEIPASETPTSNEVKPVDGDASESAKVEDDGAKVSALEELVRMGGGDDQVLRSEQAAAQEKFLEKQLTERPLLHMQEKLDSEEENDQPNEEKNGDSTNEHPHHRHNLLKDDDEELLYLEKHLTKVHTAFYDEYKAANLKTVPDIGNVMPGLKARVFEGLTFVMSGLVPLTSDLMRTEIAMSAHSFGADIQTKISKRVTHLIAPSTKTRTHKVRQAAKYPKIKIVTQQWLFDSISKWERQDEEPYLVEIHDQDRKRESPSSVPSSIHDSDDSDDETGSDGEESEVPPSQEEEADSEGVIPDDIEPGQSPIDDLKTFDWTRADDELQDFLDGDSGNDSDTSTLSESSTRSSHKSTRGIKRTHGEATDDEDSDTGSVTLKKQRISSSRTTSLKTVKTPNSGPSESSLPTPGPTDEKDSGGESEIPNGDNDFDDLEAEMEREFEREREEHAAAGDGGG